MEINKLNTIISTKLGVVIDSAEANALMDTIITKNIFLPTSGAFTSKSGTQLTERKITKYSVA